MRNILGFYFVSLHLLSFPLFFQPSQKNPEPSNYSTQAKCAIIHFAFGSSRTICSGTSTSLELSGSETTCTYELLKNGLPTGIQQAGTNASLTFDNIAEAGNYTVLAWETTDPSCTQEMDGNAVISVLPLPLKPTCTTAPTTCEKETTTPLTVTIQNSEAGIIYRVFDAPAGGSMLNQAIGTGSDMLVTVSSNKVGINQFYVEAVEPTLGCVNIGGRTPITATILPAPAIPEAIAYPYSIYCESATGTTDVNIRVNNTTNGMQYRLFDAELAALPTMETTGNGSYIDFSFPISGNGTFSYYVEAQNAATLCTHKGPRVKVDITVVPRPDKPVVSSSQAEYCMNASNLVTATVNVANSSASAVYSIYSTPTGITPIAQANGNGGTLSISYAIITSGPKTIYVEAVSLANGCANLDGRTALTFVVNREPAVNATTVQWIDQQNNKTFKLCGAAQTFSVEMKPLPGLCTQEATTLSLALAPGIEYVPGSIVNASEVGVISVAEQNTANKQNPILSVPALSSGKKIKFTYKAIATIDAYDLFNDASNAANRKFVYAYGTNANNTQVVTGFQGAWALLHITAIGKNTYTTAGGQSFSQSITIKNIGSAPADSLTIDLSEYAPELTVSAPSAGTVSGNIISVKGTDLSPDGTLDIDEEITVTFTLTVANCPAKTNISGNGGITVKWGCHGKNQTTQRGFNVMILQAEPLLSDYVKIGKLPTETWEDITTDTLVFVNKGTGAAKNLIVELRQLSAYNSSLNRNTMAEFDTTSFYAKVGKNGTYQRAYMMAGSIILNSNGVAIRNCFKQKGVSGVNVLINNTIMPNDTVFFRFNEQFIDLGLLNTTANTTNNYRRGWGYDYTYTNLCSTESYRMSSNGLLKHGRAGLCLNGTEIAPYGQDNFSFNSSNANVEEGQTYDLTLAWTLYMHAHIDPAKAYFDVIYTHPVGITMSNPRLVFPNNPAILPLPVLATFQDSPTQYRVRYQWRESFALRVEVKADFTINCAQYSASNASPSFSFNWQIISYKSNSCRGHKSIRQTSNSIVALCTQPNTVGVVSGPFEVWRQNIGKFKDDGVSPVNPATVDKQRFIYGDTLLTKFSAKIVADPGKNWTYITAAQTMPLPLAQVDTLCQTYATVKRGLKQYVFKLRKTDAVRSGGKVTFKLDKTMFNSADYPSFAFENDDSLYITTKSVVKHRTGYYNVQMPTEFYAHNVANPTLATQKFSSPPYSSKNLNFDFFLLRAWGREMIVKNDCSDIAMSQYVGILKDYNIVFNVFPNEQRNLGKIARFYIKKMPGYILKNNEILLTYVNSRSANNFNNRRMPVTSMGDYWTINIDSLNLASPDECHYYIARYTVSPTCEATNYVGEYRGDVASCLHYGTGNFDLTTSTTDLDNVTMNKPEFSVSGGGAAAATSSDLTWRIQLNNGSSTANASNVWVAAPTNNPSIKINQIVDVATGTIYTPTGEIFNVGTLNKLSSRELEVRGTLLDCSINPQITLQSYWACGAVPISAAAAPCKVAIPLSAAPVKGELISRLTDIGSAVTYCQPIEYRVKLSNSLPAEVNSIKVAIENLPGDKSLDLYPGSVSFSVGNSGIFTPAPADAVVAGANSYTILFDKLKAGGLPLSSDSVTISYQLTTKTGFVSGSSYRLSVNGQHWCGESIRSKIIVPVRIYLDGLSSAPYQMGVSLSTDPITQCDDQSFLAYATVSHYDEPTANIPAEKRLHLDLPLGVSFEEVPAGMGDNGELGAFTATTLPSGATRIVWSMPEFNNNSRTFVFRLKQQQSLECSQSNELALSTLIVTTVNCNGTPETVYMTTGDAKADITLDKPMLSPTVLTARYTEECSTGQSLLQLSGTLRNDGRSVPAGTPITVEFFADSNNDSHYSAGEYLGQYTLSSGIANGMEIAFATTVTFSSASCTAPANGFIAVVRLQPETPGAKQCVCSSGKSKFYATVTARPTITWTAPLASDTHCQGEYSLFEIASNPGCTTAWALQNNLGTITGYTGSGITVWWNKVTATATEKVTVTVTNQAGCTVSSDKTITISLKPQTGAIYHISNSIF